MTVYAVTSATVGAAAPKTSVQIVAAANARVKILGFVIGDEAATTAQGVAWELNRQTTAGTSSAQTPVPLDIDAIASRTTALSTFTAEPTAGTIVFQCGFDRIGTYIFWFPPGKEPVIANSGRIGLRKITGADTDIWRVTVFFDE